MTLRTLKSLMTLRTLENSTNMTITIHAPISPFRGTIHLPSSKSISNRALTINALTGRRGILPDNVSDCDDTRVMIEWLKTMPSVIDIGAAGTAMRFSSALLAVTDGTRVITGSERMRHRPISVLVDALRQLGAEVEYTGEEGFPPLRITGHSNLPGGVIRLPGHVSSQYISALLMIGPVMQHGLTLHLEGDIISRPYIDLTLKMMRDFGGQACWTDERTITVAPQGYVATDYHVESDWSATSYWYEMVALSSGFEVCLPVLFPDSYQGDSEVVRIFERLGVKTTFNTDNKGMSSVTLTKTPCTVKRLDYDFVNQPDLAQTLVVTCCMMGVPFRFTGLQSLRIKETDRITALEQELAKLGYHITDRDDSVMEWDGTKEEVNHPEPIDTYEDHRMAMSFAPCALVMKEISINNPQVVSKSYPRFWDDLRQAGFIINENQ